MSDETKVQETTNADGNPVSQPIAKPHVVCSQSQDETKIKIGYASSEKAKRLAEEYLNNGCLNGIRITINPETKKIITIENAF